VPALADDDGAGVAIAALMKIPPTGMKPDSSRASARQPKPPPTIGSSSHIADRSGSRP
jgi:hypothetical protein